ncbi:hypothetical protein HNP11_004204 [Tsukamurella ocularis]|uniref:hypothetical protein n=1 Tax=Tsukamurella ocularis TaxID=1970234 RepID=UPI002169CE4E|nr:hypothetical protein [Tsukamurella ocularis]MCS3790005.1 hypothetical protein [Tsukamurella ocularis]
MTSSFNDQPAHTPPGFPPRMPLEERLTQAGWSSWRDAGLWAARQHLGPDEIAVKLGSASLAQRIRQRMRPEWCQHPDTPALVAPLLQSRHGHLADDGERVQCHVCGLWFHALAQHVQSAHQISSESYRHEHGLLGQPLTSTGFAQRWRNRDTRPGDLADPWDAVLAEHGYRSLRDAVSATIDRGDDLKALAAELGVRASTLAKQIRLAGLHIPTVTDRNLALARAHVAAGNNLSDPPGELRNWVKDARARVKRGLPGPVSDELFLLDPQWMLNTYERAEHDGTAAPVGTRRVSEEHLAAALARAGFASLADAAQWADQRGVGTRGLAERLDLNVDRTRDYLHRHHIALPRHSRANKQ